MKQDDRAENVLGEEVTREGLSEEAILELRPEGEEGPGQSLPGRCRKFWGREKPGRPCEVPTSASTYHCFGYSYYMLLTIPDYFEVY